MRRVLALLACLAAAPAAAQVVITPAPGNAGSVAVATAPVPSCSNGQTLVWNASTSLWACGATSLPVGLDPVNLQTATPGTAQTGHVSITGTMVAGLFAGPLTGNVTGNVSGSAGWFTGALTGDVTSSGMATTISGLAWSKVSKSGAAPGDVGAAAASHTHTTSALTDLSSWTGSTAITTLGTIATGTVPWARLSSVPSTFAPSSHGLMASHTVSGLTTGHVLQATGATTFGFAALPSHAHAASDVTGTAIVASGSYSDPSWLTLSKSKVGLGAVENTALSTWAGSTSLTTAGALTATSLTVSGASHLSGRVWMAGDNIYAYTNELDSGYNTTTAADLWLNYRGYQDGYTQYRNTLIGDGRGHPVMSVVGSGALVGIGASPSYRLHVYQDAADWTAVAEGHGGYGLLAYGSTYAVYGSGPMFASSSITAGSSLVAGTTIFERGRSAAVGDLVAWSPTVSCSGSMTWSASSVDAKYSQVGTSVTINVNIAGTLGGTASSTVYVSLPITSGSMYYASAFRAYNGSLMGANAEVNPSSASVALQRLDGATWSTGSFVAHFTLTYWQ